ncbi:PREDICTED: equatorin-like isoform X1 [Chinchilla lanigera]|uniref:equatorin-like isoform X1 n=1 Tax=Chinchilla lanigera TaxID=34839 RepID=UPI00038EF0A7|nr:PREDICTED: equatorin-like isoform X1 [Chinchilla lanigera]
MRWSMIKKRKIWPMILMHMERKGIQRLILQSKKDRRLRIMIKLAISIKIQDNFSRPGSPTSVLTDQIKPLPTARDEFVTQNPNSNDSEITVKATTDLTFALKNYKINTTTEIPTTEEHEPIASPQKTKQKTTPTVPALWTKLVEAVSGTTVGTGDKDQLFQPIPSSDENDTSAEDHLPGLEDFKLTLILGLTLITLIIVIILLAFCIAVLFKLGNLNCKRRKRQYFINPELAKRSYFHPSKDVSDTSFSKSTQSSTFEDTSSSDPRKST